jgi:hypothetical protein
MDVSPAQLRRMALHDITRVHGEKGLRERFYLEIETFPLDDVWLILDALSLATELHEGQKRQNEDHICHVLRSAIRLVSPHHLNIVQSLRHHGIDVRFAAHIICAVLLHDTVEDQVVRLGGGGGRGKAYGELTLLSGDLVAKIVKLVTNPEHKPGLTEEEEDQLDFDHLKESLTIYPSDSPSDRLVKILTRLIKLSDFIDNVTLHHIPPTPKGLEKRLKLAQRYKRRFALFREIIESDDTPLNPEQRKSHLDHLDRAEEEIDTFIYLRLRQGQGYEPRSL